MADYKTYADNAGKYYFTDSNKNVIDLADKFEPMVHDAAPGFGTEFLGVGGFQAAENTDSVSCRYYLNGNAIYLVPRGQYPTIDLEGSYAGDFPSKFWESTDANAGKYVNFSWDENSITIGDLTLLPSNFRCNCIPEYIYVLLVGAGGGGGGAGVYKDDNKNAKPVCGGAGGGGGVVIGRIQRSDFFSAFAQINIPTGGSAGINRGAVSSETCGSGDSGNKGGDTTLTKISAASNKELIATAYGGAGGSGGGGTGGKGEYTTGTGGDGGGFTVNNSNYFKDYTGKTGSRGASYGDVNFIPFENLKFKPETSSSSAPDTPLARYNNYATSYSGGSYGGDGISEGKYGGGLSLYEASLLATYISKGRGGNSGAYDSDEGAKGYPGACGYVALYY